MNTADLSTASRAQKRKVTIKPIDWVDPVNLFTRLSSKPGFVWLDCGKGYESQRRWSYMMWEPMAIISGAGNEFTIYQRGVVEQISEDPFDLIESYLSQYETDTVPDAPDFTGGLAGFLGYGLLRHLESSTKLVQQSDPPEGDLWLGIYDAVVAFDHEKKETLLIANLPEPINPDSAIADLEEIVRNGIYLSINGNTKSKKSPIVEPVISREAYIGAVECVRKYIEQGDCYQANISQRFVVTTDTSPVDIYLRLRRINPAPHAAYLDTGQAQILSSSPERFLKLRCGKALSSPIKGTRPRGLTPDQDEQLVYELTQSGKDRAENVMIVDLVRNDLSKVCLANSVKVTGICAVEKYPTLFHLTSTVEGALAPGLGPIDLIKSSFPAGSITGAPKIRAMEIIDELEHEPRGVYCGSIGFIGFDGVMDLNVAIRTMVKSGGRYSFRAGGGITHSSDPESEYQETLDKAKALLEAIKG